MAWEWSVAQAQEAAREWIFRQGLAAPGDRKGDVMRRLAEYRAALGRSARPDRLAWAREVVADYEAGRPVQPACLKLARGALGVDGVPLVRKVTPPPPRPDVRERQAGDGDPAF